MLFSLAKHQQQDGRRPPVQSKQAAEHFPPITAAEGRSGVTALSHAAVGAGISFLGDKHPQEVVTLAGVFLHNSHLGLLARTVPRTMSHV